MATIQEISQDAKDQIQRRIEERDVREKELEERRAQENKDKYINLGDKQKVVLKFEVEKNTSYKEFANKYGGITKRYFYPVIDPNTGEDKVFSSSTSTSKVIDTFLRKGITMLEIERQGVEKATQYIVTQA